MTSASPTTMLTEPQPSSVQALLEAVEEPKRKRGRPRIHPPKPQHEGPKRPRGRPRKNPLAEPTSPAKTDPVSTDGAGKRGPGRPRKSK